MFGSKTKITGQMRDQPRLVFEVHTGDNPNQYLFQSLEPVRDNGHYDSAPFGDERRYRAVERRTIVSAQAAERRQELIERGYVKWAFDDVTVGLRSYATTRVCPTSWIPQLNSGIRRYRKRISVWIQH